MICEKWMRRQDSNLRSLGYEPNGDGQTPPLRYFGAPCPIRTDDLSLTRRVLWPAELKGQIKLFGVFDWT